jgi:hypothetical protein
MYIESRPKKRLQRIRQEFTAFTEKHRGELALRFRVIG